ncbi:hypothetical protein QU481_11015 [Crenobacter sp. SG2303]|uniref:DUF2157 domain-containing protein n=1 Tax=Crenobacter oryzisoli TaxID=3056844 RepID=A0ABT7XNP3_9NEIS|nr:hypothetical protein [Crenobacter sp. SG2303]MDN0075421.1 hypothetical protein [Crenobacter sp. SG2303]
MKFPVSRQPLRRHINRNVSNAQKKPTIFGYLKAILELDLFVKLSPYAFIIGGGMLYLFLDSIGLKNLFQPSLNSVAGFVTLVLGGMLLAFSMYVLLVIAPAFMTQIALIDGELHHARRSRMYFVGWFVLLALSTLSILVIGMKEWPILLAFLEFALSAFVFWWIFSSKQTWLNGRAQLLSLISLTAIVQFLFILPMSILLPLARGEAHQDAVFFAIWAAYIALCILYVYTVSKYPQPSPAVRKRGGIGWVIISAAVFFLIVTFSKESFLHQVAHGIGVTDSPSEIEWYILSSKAVAEQGPKLTGWPATDIEKNGYVYGFMAFRFSDQRVLCPSGQVLNKEVSKYCLLLEKDDVKPMGWPKNWKNPEQDKKRVMAK